MNNKKQELQRKIEFLQKKLGELHEEYPCNNQSSFLLDELDFYKAELLKIEVREHYANMNHEND